MHCSQGAMIFSLFPLYPQLLITNLHLSSKHINGSRDLLFEGLGNIVFCHHQLGMLCGQGKPLRAFPPVFPLQPRALHVIRPPARIPSSTAQPQVYCSGASFEAPDGIIPDVPPCTTHSAVHTKGGRSRACNILNSAPSDQALATIVSSIQI